jgi:hypothetical protein
VIVFDADFVGITALPSKRDPILIVDPNAVPTRAIAFQPLEAVTRGNRQIFETRGHVQQFQLPLNRAPKLARDSSGWTGISLPKQIRRGAVTK